MFWITQSIIRCIQAWNLWAISTHIIVFESPYWNRNVVIWYKAIWYKANLNFFRKKWTYTVLSEINDAVLCQNVSAFGLARFPSFSAIQFKLHVLLVAYELQFLLMKLWTCTSTSICYYLRDRHNLPCKSLFLKTSCKRSRKNEPCCIWKLKWCMWTSGFF